MLEVTKKEAEYLKSKGLRNKHEIFFSGGCGKTRKRYCVENENILKMLKAFRESRIIETVGETWEEKKSKKKK